MKRITIPTATVFGFSMLASALAACASEGAAERERIPLSSPAGLDLGSSALALASEGPSDIGQPCGPDFGSGLSVQPVISVDGAGNRYVAGSFEGVVIFGESGAGSRGHPE